MPNELDDVKVDVVGVKPPFTITSDSPVSKAAEKMLREKVHSIVVVDKNNKPAGMISAWDIMKVTFLSEGSRDLPISKMIEGQKLVFVYEEVTVRDALNLMINKGIRSLPILDDKDNLTGKISLTDIAKFVKEKL
jgi:CBS domain-containing protein